MVVVKKFFWLVLVLGLILDSTAGKAQYGCGADPYVNYTYFEACQDFLDGDQNIENERRDIDFSKCLDRWPELG
mgnify:CR=1 FL=1|tara:strand:- start:376 stop:597 length:222 start_codon:yes stop_codon:yes gene_type:complete